MRGARVQSPLHLQVCRSSTGKFLVNSESSSNHFYHHHHHHNHNHSNYNRQNNSNQNNQQQQVQKEKQNVIEPQLPNGETVTVEKKEQTSGSSLLGERFLLLGPAEGSTLYKCVDVKTGQQLIAKALSTGEKGGELLLQSHMLIEGRGATSELIGIVQAPTGSKRYLLLEGHYGDLHAYVRARRRLREPEARRLFKQAAKAVQTCHENGLVLRDLKLRKFVFADEARTKLRLESLEDAVIVDEDNDRLTDRRGCPAYVAPEVLRSGRAYSGKAADMWSLGVLLYTMLVGRYPFNDAEHASLFAKISRGQFAVPEGLSSRARCLVRALLRREPSERPLVEDALRHPWFNATASNSSTSYGRSSHDQLVPDITSLYED